MLSPLVSLWLRADRNGLEKAGSIDVSNSAELLEVENGSSIARRRRFDVPRRGSRRRRVPNQRLNDDAAAQYAIRWQLNAEEMRNGWRDVGVADGRLIDIAPFKVRSDRSHVVQRAVSPYPAMHSLAV